MKSNYFLFYTLILLLGITAFFSCDKDEEISGIVAGQLTSTINSDITYQTIAGFGGANRMWGTQFLKPEEAALAFGTAEGQLGLSIFRVRIAANPAEWPNILESVQEAQNRGVKIIAAPWSPPYNLKSNNQEVGGYLLPENYEAFKDHINDFVSFMNQNGVDIYAVSIQNEPDIQVSYESCDWTSGQMIDFISNYGHLIENTKISAPESFNFNQNFTNALLNNPSAVENFDIVAGHIYGGGLGAFPLAEEKNKEIWMTEYLLNLNTGNQGASPWTSYDKAAKWDESLQMLHTIHEAMINNWNAYLWWYIQRYYSFIGDGQEGTTDGTILKRGYAFAHFSKYIRPGFVRVDQTTNKPNVLEITAYENDNQIVVVIINQENTLVPDLHINTPSISSAVAYTTTLEVDMDERNVITTDGKVALDVAPKSISTIIIKR